MRVEGCGAVAVVGSWHCVVLGVLFCESVGILVMQVMQDLVGQLGLLALVSSRGPRVN